jgi:hypothetical protein
MLVVSHPTSEIVAFHKLKRRFVDLKDIEKEDMNELIMCEFKGPDFDLEAD